ncbi:methyltransferase [Puniceicoccaceae bacterium K14]|nr:methyltransferase [Puniceicoccaceae bacterium K14]
MSQSTQMLSRAITLENGQKGLLVVDENTRIRDLKPQKLISVLTNRYELERSIRHKGFEDVRFSDFDFNPFPDSSLDLVAHRVGKDKSATHHIINQAFRILKPGGRLILAGVRKEGTKTYGEKASALFACSAESQTTSLGARIVILQKNGEAKENFLNDKDYSLIRNIELNEELVVSSKPGIFGWEKIDQGSKFLVENLPSFEGKTVIDLGCGYGYLSIQAKRLGANKVLATDNNAAAIDCCIANFEKFEIEGSVEASNAAKHWDKEIADIVLCNPPFHKGTKQSSSAADVFSRSMRKILKKDGAAYVVVNAFVPFEKAAKEHFDYVEVLANNKQFKVLKLSST